MSTLVYRITYLLTQVLQEVPLGTNLGIFHVLFALLSGRFLPARGAVFPALASLGLAPEAVRRSEAALCYGVWHVQNLLQPWQQWVQHEGRFVPASYEGVQPVACDLTAFFRPQLQGLTSKHYVSSAGKALPAVVFGVSVAVGHIGATRLGVPRLIVRRAERENEATLQSRLVRQVHNTLSPEEALIVDAGFTLGELLGIAGILALCRISGQVVLWSSPRRYTISSWKRGIRCRQNKRLTPRSSNEKLFDWHRNVATSLRPPETWA